MPEILHLSPAAFGAFALLVFTAHLAGRAATALKLPKVVGELILGMCLGLITPFASFCRQSEALQFLGEIGILLLLFEVGFDLTLAEMRKTGLPAAKVAVIGIALPAALGTFVSWAFAAASSWSGHFFIGATLTATSVGLTARVLRDADRAQTTEAKIILGAAVIDDVLGLLLLAFVTALVRSTGSLNNSVSALLIILGKAGFFVLLALAIGHFLIPYLFRFVGRLLGRGAFLLNGVVICLTYSYFAELMGMAAAVGAFFAGLVIQPRRNELYGAHADEKLKDSLAPLLAIFTPLFFVLTGMKVDISVLGDVQILAFAGVLCVVAVAGKVAAGLAAGSGVNRLLVGVGMVPRGEVGLIFAALGAQLISNGQPVVSSPVFAALILVVAITSVVSPLWLGLLAKKV